MSPKMIETARALAAVWTGPALVQHVVSEGERSHLCLECEAVSRLSASDDGLCPLCGEGRWEVEPTYPDRDTVPDLTSNAVGGEVLVALWKIAPDARPSPNKGGTVGVRWDYVENGDHRDCVGHTLAHAATKAYLEASR